MELSIKRARANGASAIVAAGADSNRVERAVRALARATDRRAQEIERGVERLAILGASEAAIERYVARTLRSSGRRVASRPQVGTAKADTSARACKIAARVEAITARSCAAIDAHRARIDREMARLRMELAALASAANATSRRSAKRAEHRASCLRARIRALEATR